MNLEDLGFDPDFFKNPVPQNTKIARVIAVDKGSYLIHNGNRESRAEITGKFMFNAESSLDYPTVGDWVATQFFDQDDFAVIHEVLPRKSLLKRKAAGKKVDFQLIAANIDAAFVMQSLDRDYNRKRLERYLVMIGEENITPAVLLSKSDLVSEADMQDKIDGIKRHFNHIEVVAFSHQNMSNFGIVKALFKPKQTYCLIGSSGVGKTTLLNHLLEGEYYETQEVRKSDGRGRHTTTRRQLLHLKNGAMIIDTPGMRELGNLHAEDGMEEVFDEMFELARQCRFSDCAHVQDDGCAILDALNRGDISEERYDNFIKMMRESQYYEMSYVQKRNKDKAFGRMVKRVQKDMAKSEPEW